MNWIFLVFTPWSYLILIITFLPYPNSSPATKLDKSAPVVSYLKCSLLGAALNPLPSCRLFLFMLWLCPAILVPFGSVFSAFLPNVSLPFVVSGLGVLFSSGFGTRFKPLFLYATNAL